MPSQTRREFLRNAAVGAVGLGMGPSALSGEEDSGQPASAGKLERRNVQPGMRYHRLGRTNIAVSALSAGVTKAPVLFAALEKGVNFVHTATGYNNVPDVAQVAAKHRDRMFIAIKAGPVDEYRALLRVDYVDVLFLSRMGPEDARDSRGRLREDFERMKRQGKVRFFGLTIHHNDLVGTTRAAVESDTWDIIMPQYQPQLRAQLDPILAKARQKGIGVLAMKTLVNLPRGATDQEQALIRTALSSGRLDSVIISIPSFEAMNRYVEAATTPVKARDHALLRTAIQDMKRRKCGFCGECGACPQGVEIAEILRCKDYYAGQKGDVTFARAAYRELAESQRVANCADCGCCDRVCPEGLPVRQMLQQAHALLS